MNRIELAEVIYKSFDFAEMKNPGAKRNRVVTRAQVLQMIDVYHAAITSTLSREGSVTMKHFGTWIVRRSDARSGRNPRTGAAIVIPSKKRPRFLPSKKMRQAVFAGI
jgi:nucleoid DNA-binding protein